MSQIEWFKQRNVFHKLTEQEIYLALNVAHDQRNEQMIAQIVDSNADTIEKLLRKDQQHFIPHTSSSFISPTIWAFAENRGVIEADMDQFCVFAVKHTLNRGLHASASDFIVQWLNSKVFDNASIDSLSYFYFWSVRKNADIFARAVEKHPSFPLVNIKNALKFAAKQPKDAKVFASECKDVIGSVFASLQRIDGAASFLKIFDNLSHTSNNSDTVDLLEKNLLSHFISSGIFEHKRSEFLKEVLSHDGFLGAFQQTLDRGIPFSTHRFDKGSVVDLPVKGYDMAHSLSDLAVINSRLDIVLDLMKVDPEGVNKTLSNPQLATEFCRRMYFSDDLSPAKLRSFFNKIDSPTADKNNNTFAHYFVQWNMEHSRDYDQILKDLYAICPQWRHRKNKRNKSPLDLLETKTSQNLRDTLESKQVAATLKSTTKSLGQHVKKQRKI